MGGRGVRVGAHVQILTFARIALGKIIKETPAGYVVRLPNWQADGVHLDVTVGRDEVKTVNGRAEVCQCVYCKSTVTRVRKTRAVSSESTGGVKGATE